MQSGKIILQDKASCFPAIALSPPDEEDVQVIDATAAPGNKTTLLSALMKGKGKVSRETLLTLRLVLTHVRGTAVCLRKRQETVWHAEEDVG